MTAYRTPSYRIPRTLYAALLKQTETSAICHLATQLSNLMLGSEQNQTFTKIRWPFIPFSFIIDSTGVD